MARSTTRTSTSNVAALAAQVEALTAMVAALTQGTTSATNPVSVATPGTKARTKSTRKASPKSSKGPKVYTWKPWACSKFAIPAIVGASFAYSGKSGTSDHIVTSVSPDGIVTSVRA